HRGHDRVRPRSVARLRQLLSGRPVSRHGALREGAPRGAPPERRLEPDGVLVLPAGGERTRRGDRHGRDQPCAPAILPASDVPVPALRGSRQTRLVQAGAGGPAGITPAVRPEDGNAPRAAVRAGAHDLIIRPGPEADRSTRTGSRAALPRTAGTRTAAGAASGSPAPRAGSSCSGRRPGR